VEDYCDRTRTAISPVTVSEMRASGLRALLILVTRVGGEKNHVTGSSFTLRSRETFCWETGASFAS
jgi:hypothetical protein